MAYLNFQNPEFLFLLAGVPLLIAAHHLLYRFTRKKGMVFSNFDTLKRVTGKKVLTRNLGILILRMLAFSLIVLALSGPVYWYEGLEQDSDYVIAIDMSASMTAQDFPPTRVDAAKEAAIRFIDELEGAAHIGVIAFSGAVLVEEPPTLDREAARQAVRRVHVRTISGTDIPGALITGTNLLLPHEEGRVIILISDGSTTAGTFLEDALKRGVAYAKEREVVVHAIAIGDDGSAPIGYLPQLYNIPAVSNKEDLAYIANQTGGRMIEARNVDELIAAYSGLASDGRSTLQQYALQQTLLLAAVLLLFLEWGLTNTRFRLIP